MYRIRLRVQNFYTEMAAQWRIAVVICLVLFIMMTDTEPVLAGNKERIKALEIKVKALEETCMDKCNR